MVDNRKDTERRKFPRIDLDKSVNYHTVDDNKIRNGLAKDVSAGGVQLISFDFIPKDKRVVIEIQLDDDIIKTTSMVVWTKKLPYSGRYQIGLQFNSEEEEISDSVKKTKDVVSEYVNNRLP